MRTNLLSIGFILTIAVLFIECRDQPRTDQIRKNNYSDLVALFKKWRSTEHPVLKGGVPDYTNSALDLKKDSLNALRKQLLRIDTTGWSIPQQVDWHILWAEMNGFEFNLKVLKPWERDPAFYKTLWTERSDVPAHEGPTHHSIIDLWQYAFPLNADSRNKLIEGLKVIPPLNRQAMFNLKGNARDLWMTGIRDIQTQSTDLTALLGKKELETDTELKKHIQEAIASTDSLVDWLVKEATQKNGPSGIGKENYTWFIRNVLLVPLDWQEEVTLLERELSRSWSSLQLEEHHNRELPQLKEVTDTLSYNQMADAAVEDLINFLDKEQIITVKDYFLPALQAHKGSFIPKEKRHFFWIATHYDPRPLYSHFYHWFELAQMDMYPHPSEIRRKPLLYNIFCSHNEGMATAVEEIFLQTGLYDKNPRVREIVYILLAQRAARGLGSLYAHANEMDMEQAGGIHTNLTPRGWMKTEKELQQFEQQLFLRQPGYGTSYITGKFLIDEMIAEIARQRESKKKPFELKKVMDAFSECGSIPVSLIHWELTGDKTPIKNITEFYKPLM